MNCDSEYLLEKVDSGEAMLLFNSEKDAKDYIEKCDLALWIACMSKRDAEKYSLEQLRKVKEILEKEE